MADRSTSQLPRRPPGRRLQALALALVLAAAGLASSPAAPMGDAAVVGAATTVRTEVLVYGGTPGGVLAAVTAARAGAKVVLLEPTEHLGGMMSSGLSWTDIGNKSTLGGYTKELFDRIAALEGSNAARYAFQPHTAEVAFRALIHSTDVDVRYRERVADRGRIGKDRTRLTWIRSDSGVVYRAAVFIDASYEGDLLARSGATFRLGRESSTEYGESLAGVRPTQVVVGDLQGVRVPDLTKPPGAVGSADDRVQDSNFRVCFSSDPANQTPFEVPGGYDWRDYEVVLRYLREREGATGLPARLSWVISLQPLAADKWDVNDSGLMSTAVPGLNWSWSELDVHGRADLADRHRANSQGLFWFLRHDRRVPVSIRTEITGFGLCRDEFTDNGNWPWLLYIREGRRMVGATVLTQADITTTRQKPDIIGIGSYRIDSHLVSRWVDATGALVAEGTMSTPYRDYAIPYRAITPDRGEVTNLLVPVAASASHVAHSSLRMEPHYMLMGEAAGEAAAMAIRRGRGGTDGVPASTDVQVLDVTRLGSRLVAHGSKLTNPP